ncbi:MAG: hypothetical protein L0I24_08950 [Pseudonocardia sp.]|nr:hypothetical protein [Pseudonocardia sp.]
MRVTFVYVGHRPNDSAIRALIRRSGDLDARSARVLTAARQQVGVASGTLLASLRREFGEDGNGAYVDIVAGVDGLTPYALLHHEGTPPHVIRPRRRRALRFIAGGQVVFSQKVNHPGTAPNRYLTDSLRAAR